MRGAVRSKERWKGRRAPTQDRSAKYAPAAKQAREQAREKTGERSQQQQGVKEAQLALQAELQQKISEAQGKRDALGGPSKDEDAYSRLTGELTRLHSRKNELKSSLNQIFGPSNPEPLPSSRKEMTSCAARTLNAIAHSIAAAR